MNTTPQLQGQARFPRGGLLLAVGLFSAAAFGALACTLGEDFEPRSVDNQPDDVTEVTGAVMATGGAAGCTDPRGCCATSQECGAGQVCLGGICQVLDDCSSLDDVSVCQIELCPGPSCPSNVAQDSCTDGVRNQDETGIDCGGSCPAACGSSPSFASCSDGVRNQDETDLDCGGSCGANCAAGKGCAQDGDCNSDLLCSPGSHICTEISCADGRQDGAEILIDCGGGSCPGCPVGTACVNASDCNSGICALGTCRASPLCEDGTRDGEETDVDCGGSDTTCDRCADGKACRGNTDCARGNCAQALGAAGGAGGTCISCQDGLRNGSETAVDCGGPDLTCRRCASNATCGQNRDCQSGICSGGVCVNFSCDDNRLDGNETGVDCGGNGVGCARCADGVACRQGSDCASGSCAAGECVSCQDSVRNGTETDVDCGGTCGSCAPGRACGRDGDCASGACVDGRCCGGSQGDCTRCAERLSPTIDCDSPQSGQDSTGVLNCRNFLQCLASNPAICSTRNAPGCSGDNQASDACPHNDYGGNAGTGLTRANQVLLNAGCQL